MGMFTSTMSLSDMPSRYFTMARSEFPCATMKTSSPASIRGLMTSLKYGMVLAMVSFRLSVRGSSSAGIPLYCS